MQSEANTCVQDCLNLIHRSRVMTLSTGTIEPNQCRSVWNAPVYFIHKENGFYFFSNPASHHIRQGEGNPAAASIFEDGSVFSDLKGIQMSGRIKACKSSRQTVSAATEYVRKYGIQPGRGNILEFFSTRFSSRLYRFDAKTTYYMDNSKGIGNRVKLTF